MCLLRDHEASLKVFETCFSALIVVSKLEVESSISPDSRNLYAYSLMCNLFRSILRRTKVFLKYWHAEKLTEQLQKAQEAVIKIQRGICLCFEEANLPLLWRALRLPCSCFIPFHTSQCI